MPGIKLNTGLPASIVDALALRGGRAEYEQALRLLSDVVPVVVLAGGEQASTGGGTTTESQGFMRAHALTAGPGLAPLVQLSNPVGSNVNLLLDTLSWQTAAAGLVHLRRNSPAVIGAVGPGWSKTLSGGATSQGIVNQGAPAAVSGDEFEYIGEGITYGLREYKRPVIITPGTNLTIFNQVAASVLRAGFEWREAPI